jgi:hypothetical protein
MEAKTKYYLIGLAIKRYIGSIIKTAEDNFPKDENEAKHLFGNMLSWEFLDEFGFVPDFIQLEVATNKKEFKKKEKLIKALKKVFEKK